jgi:hypothetical protein
MKNYLLIFVHWFLGLFKSRKQVEVVQEAVPVKKYVTPEPTKFVRRNRRSVPLHNNRKNTRGRYTQFTPSGRAIYHDISRKK